PDEVAADRAAELEAVTGSQLLGQIRGDLTVVEPLDGDGNRFSRRRGDRILPFGAVSVLRGQPYVEMLAGPVTRPLGHVGDDRPHLRRFVDHGFDRGDLPGQSPE